MVRVDQSHCNYRLDLALQADGWEIVFKDPGRVSRGIGDHQAKLLRLFESESLPIPDLVALRDSKLLLVEIDHRLAAALNSLRIYRELGIFLCDAIQNALSRQEDLSTLLLAFCRIGPMRSLARYQAAGLLDVAIGFDQPNTPTFNWLSTRA